MNIRQYIHLTYMDARFMTVEAVFSNARTLIPSLTYEETWEEYVKVFGDEIPKWKRSKRTMK